MNTSSCRRYLSIEAVEVPHAQLPQDLLQNPREYAVVWVLQKSYLKGLVVNSHLAADPELYFESVHADEVPRVKKRLVFFGWGHEPIVRILRKQSLRNGQLLLKT